MVNEKSGDFFYPSEWQRCAHIHSIFQLLDLPINVFQQTFITSVYRFPGPPTIFKDLPVLENARLKFKDFSGHA